MSLPSAADLDPSKLSPMMIQWQNCKLQAPEALLLFRLGDFYEAFYQDAEILAKELNLTLTKRQDIPMSGIPHHTSDGYIDKLIAKGYRIAVAEQTEDPKKTKGIVKREIVRIVTPGTVVNSHLLNDKANNFIVALTQVGKIIGLACLDVTTGDFFVSEFTHLRELINDIHRLQPAEFLTTGKFQTKYDTFFQDIRQCYSFLTNTQPDWHFDFQTNLNFLTKHFKVQTLDGFGLQGYTASLQSAGALLRYIQNVLSLSIDHIQDIRPHQNCHYMLLDRTTQRNLELTHAQDGSRKNTLLSVLDHTNTPMGGRLIHHWIKQPLLSIQSIQERQAAIFSLLSEKETLDLLRTQLNLIKDIERLIMRISTGYASARDVVALKYSMCPIETIKSLTLSLPSPLLNQLASELEALPELTEMISHALVDEPPLRLGDGLTFREGYHSELDELREISRNSKEWIAKYQTKLRDETGIKTLKVGFTKMFGYYIEVSRGQSDRMPENFIRRQTLVNAERFISPVLKDYESKVLTAEERMQSIENELFQELRSQIVTFTKRIYLVSQKIAQIDCLCSLTEAARLNDYCCPQMNTSHILHIEDGRHPVIEQVYKNERFIPNDTYLDADKQRLLLITGPNMAGKSTYLRQVALMTIMAQIGSFIPAKHATLAIVDKVFTRIGASDDLSRGQSTFMVEMTEAANILNNATSHSLVILDEIGRGTSTYDGISIAWSIAEYLLTTTNCQAKTLFATHYWELTKLEEQIPGAVNYQVAVDESDNQVTFLRKIVKGGTDKSYGIHVAKLAGLPLPALQRAQEILKHLEENANRKNVFKPTTLKNPASPRPKSHLDNFHLSLF